MERKPGLYIHVPFCCQKCKYCGFYSLTQAESLYNDYQTLTLRGIQDIASALATSTPTTLYIGGGTPSLFPIQMLEKMLFPLLSLYPWEEITIEANPGTLTLDKCKAYKELGINRISLGIQSLDDPVLGFLGRIHTAQEAYAALEMSQKFFSNISVDVIYAIPGIPSQTLQQTLQILVDQYAVQHISTYCLTIEENTAFAAQGVVVSEDQFAQEYLWIHNWLCSMGYEHYEVSNFAKPGYKSQHNSKYWDRSPYLGLGPSSHSLWENRRFCFEDWNDFQQSRIWEKYKAAPVLSSQEQREEQIFLGLRTNQGIAMDWLEPPAIEQLQYLQQAELIEMTDQTIRATVHGWMVLNSMLTRLI